MTSVPPTSVTRVPQGRVVGGVCVGLAAHYQLQLSVVRLLFCMLAIFGGFGLLAYAAAWALIPMATAAAGATAAPGAAVRRRRLPTWMWLLAIGGMLLAMGASVRFVAFGVHLTTRQVVPVVLMGAGVVLVWTMLDERARDRFLPGDGGGRGRAVVGIGLGVATCVAGLLFAGAGQRSLTELGEMAFAVLVVLGGVIVLAAPWLARLWNDYRTEQTERVRATERADIAAHLHDSVLQTLALIQRRSSDATAVARLARAQERELRSYLYGADRSGVTTLAGACREAVEEVEDRHGTPVDLVISGDRPLNEDMWALVAALREAVANAVRHGAPPVTAFVEVSPDGVDAFVRDHGPGFILEDVPADRLGVRGSVIGRMERHGGTATIRNLSTGTEVALRLPGATPEQGD